MRILGVDVSSGSATVCPLDKLPCELKKYRKGIRKVKATKEGIETMLSLEPDGAVLEPTGGHYSKLWATHLERNGVLVRWVDHSALGHYRKMNRCANKNDAHDAVALAAYGLQYWDRANYFINPSHLELKQLALQLKHQNKPAGTQLKMLRQQLEHEWPEWAKAQAQRRWLYPNPAGFIRFIAGEKDAPIWQRRLDETVGLGLSDFSRQLAIELCLIERHKLEIEQAIERQFDLPEFQPYVAALSRCGVSRGKLAALLIGHVYPFERFLDDGKVIWERVITSGGNKPKRNRSLAAFKLRCGMGLIHYQSGDSSGERRGGSFELKEAMKNWTGAAVVKCSHNPHPFIQELRAVYKAAQGNYPIRISKVNRKLTEKIFAELLQELYPQ